MRHFGALVHAATGLESLTLAVPEPEPAVTAVIATGVPFSASTWAVLSAAWYSCTSDTTPFTKLLGWPLDMARPISVLPVSCQLPV